MGLDQYLYAKLRTYKAYGNEKEDKRRNKIRKAFPEIYSSGNIESISITFEAGYWRKANAIHKWFVDNVQNEKDDCGNYYVSRDDLIKLKLLCEKVMENKDKADEILPTTDGFFFGETKYDEWYYKNIKETIEIINKCLKLPEEWSFEYESSW